MGDLALELLGDVLERLGVVPARVVVRDADDLVVLPFSSSILNSAIGFTGMTQPGKVGSDTQTRQSSGSSSRPRWPIR